VVASAKAYLSALNKLQSKAVTTIIM